jgi:molybdopterin synthase sulfur carrier subunit
MITLKLLCFGITKEMVGGFEKTIDLPEKSSVADLLVSLKTQYPELVKLNSLRVAVNEEYAEDSLILNHRDEVVLIPPVSGG